MLDTAFSVIENEEQRSELSEFYLKNKNRLYSIAFSKLHNAEEAEDAVQEIFSRIADKPERFFDIPIEKRLAYADVMVRNVAVDMFNEKNRIPVEQLDENEPENDILTLENSFFDRISRDEILSFINDMPALQRNVLTMHCFFDITIDETAKRLNISIAAAKKRLMLARKAIKTFIDERSKDHE